MPCDPNLTIPIFPFNIACPFSSEHLLGLQYKSKGLTKQLCFTILSRSKTCSNSCGVSLCFAYLPAPVLYVYMYMYVHVHVVDIRGFLH